MIGCVFLFCLLFRWGCYWWLGDAGSSSGFLYVHSHYLILSRVSSLVVYGLGVSAPISKAQGLIFCQERRFHKWFVMALSEIKTNIQNQETKDEPQTNVSYKIRQITIKIMDYTHTHIHPWAKSKQSNKNKVQLIDPVNKGNQKLCLPVKNKTNWSTNWKTKKQGAKWGIKQWKQD